MKKRTFAFDEYQKKISENIEEIGFRKYVQEHEEESVSVDDLGEGDVVTHKGEETPISNTTETPEKDETETLGQPIDIGNREDISLDEIKLNMDTINGYVKILSNRVANSDKVQVDKATKEKILKLYNIIQGIS